MNYTVKALGMTMTYTSQNLMDMFLSMYPKYKPSETDSGLSELEETKKRLRELLDDLTSSFSEDENPVYDWLDMLISKRILMFGENDETHSTISHVVKAYQNVGKPKDYDFQDDNVYEQRALYALAGDLRSITFMPKSKFLTDVVSEKGYNIRRGTCYDCGKTLGINIKGVTVTLYCPDGQCKSNRFHKFRVKFPSGKVVADDSLNSLVDVLGRPKAYLNDGLSSEVIYNNYYAERNVAHIFVGNTGPNIYIDGNKIIGCDESELGNKVGSICTDLWWTTMMDHDEYVNLLKEAGKSEQEIKEIFDFWTFNVFDVEPGTYEFTSRYSSFDEDEFDGVYFEAVKVSD